MRAFYQATICTVYLRAWLLSYGRAIDACSLDNDKALTPDN